MIDREELTGVILCGGAGARLGGEDKPLLRIGEHRIIDLICLTLESQTATILLSCSRNVAIYESFGHQVLVDRERNRGPLAGLTQSFERVGTEWILVTPGDMPFLPANLVALLEPDARAQGVAVPEIGGVRQNLNLLLNSASAASLVRFAEDGGKAVKYWLEQQDIQSTSMGFGEQEFLNVNSRADLARAREALRRREQA